MCVWFLCMCCVHVFLWEHVCHCGSFGAFVHDYVFVCEHVLPPFRVQVCVCVCDVRSVAVAVAEYPPIGGSQRPSEERLD